MEWPRRRRPSGRGRLVAGFCALGLLVLVSVGVGRLWAGVGPFELSGSLWRFLGVRVVSPAPADGPPAEEKTGVPPSTEAGGAGAQAQGAGPAGTGDPATLSSGAGDTVVAGATFVWTVDYHQCGCEVTDDTLDVSGLVGLTRQALATELRDWEITSFAPSKVEARRVELAAMCPKHTRRTLRLEGGKLILYAGSIADQPPDLIPLGPTAVTEGDLSPSEADLLGTGRSFDSQEEVVRYLEGLGD